MNINQLTDRWFGSPLFSFVRFFFWSFCLVLSIELTFPSCWHPWHCSLIRNDKGTTILWAPFTFYLLTTFYHYTFGRAKLEFRDQSGSFDQSSKLFLTCSNSTAVLITWLKPSNRSHGFRLAGGLRPCIKFVEPPVSFNVVFNFSVQDFIQILH